MSEEKRRYYSPSGPVVGDIVHYVDFDGEGPWVAIVTHVHSPTCVDLLVQDAEGEYPVEESQHCTQDKRDTCWDEIPFPVWDLVRWGPQ